MFAATIRKTRFGPQPIRSVMQRERWTNAALANEVGVGYVELYNAITGKSAPTVTLCDRLAKALKTPAHDLFTTAALAEVRS